MSKTIHYISIFVSLFIITSIAMGDAFDDTVDEIKTLEADLAQNQIDIDEKQTFIDEELATFRANHALNAPKGEFESDADYTARINRLNAAVTQRRNELENEHLSPLQVQRKEIQSDIWSISRRVFYTHNVTATLGLYDANSESFPITFKANDQTVSVRLYISRHNNAPMLKENWDKVVKKAYISIDPGHQRGLRAVGLEYSPLWKNGLLWRFDLLYDLGDNKSVDFSPDGKYITAGSNKEHGKANIWKMEDGTVFRKMNHGDRVHAVAFSPDGKYIVTAGEDERGHSSNGKAIRWNMSNGTKSSIISTRAHVYEIAFSPDSKFLATVTYPYLNGGTVNLWRSGQSGGPGGWKNFYDYGLNRSLFSDKPAFSPDSRSIAIGNEPRYSNTLYRATLWNFYTGSKTEFRHKQRVYSIAFSPNGKYLVTGHYESVILWEVNSGRSVRQIKLSNTYAYSVTFSPDGEYLAVGKSNDYINLFQVGTDDITFETEIPRVRSIYAGSKVYDLAWHPSGNYISDGKKVFRSFFASEIVNLTPPTIYFPEIESVNAGTTFTLDVRIKDVPDLSGWQLEVTYNPDVVSVVEVKDGDFLKGGNGNTLFQGGNIDNTTGKVTGLSSVLIGDSGISGVGSLLSLTFEAKSAGDAGLQLLNTILTNSSAETITHEIDIHPIIIVEGFLPEDVNQDKVVNIIDLTLVASNFGKTGTNIADVNGDGVVNIVDLTLVAAAFGNTASAPVVWDRDSEIAPTRADVEAWLREARQLNLTDPSFQRGIQVLERLLASLTPKETALLPNYPNPFNPETWIPFQLAAPADVSISIYATDGKLIRTLDLGHQPIGKYHYRGNAAHWDGKNTQGEPIASGVYFYTLTAGKVSATRKMLIRK